MEYDSVDNMHLGAGSTNDKRLPANSKLSGNTLVRLAEGIRIYREVPGSKIVTSAFGGKNEDISQAEITAEVAVILGVNKKDIYKQTKPENTWMEATEFKRLFGNSVQPVVVTSAIHMPRAMYLFRKAGLNPIAAPTDFKIKKDKNRDFWFWLPSAGNINKMESAIHEYVGLLWYKFTIGQDFFGSPNMYVTR